VRCYCTEIDNAACSCCVSCSECKRVEPERVIMATQDGHALIRTFFGKSVACSGEGRRILKATRKAGAR